MAEATQTLEVNNKTYRLDARVIAQYGFPHETEWMSMSASDLIKNCGPELLRERVPINWKMVDNLREEPIRNPILVGPDWWIWVGSQRVRAMQWLIENEGLERPFLVCKLKYNFIKAWKLWGGTEATKAAAIEVQIIETLFKSIYYSANKTVDGMDMYKFEEEGDNMYWSIRDDNPMWNEEKGVRDEFKV